VASGATLRHGRFEERGDGPVGPGDPVTSLEPLGADGGGFDLELAVSSLAADSGDVGLMMRLLVEQLASALGSRLTVERSGGRFRRNNEIRAVQVALGEDVLRADIDGSSVRCTIGHSSGGIRIRSEQVDIATWLRRLLSALGAEAAQSEQTRRALENIVIGGST
jgi:hypothetical protein